jgi:selenoprotein W-related protein
MAKLLNAYESAIGGITLVPSDGGRFEVEVNDRLLYSKLETGRHVEEGEIEALLEEVI